MDSPSRPSPDDDDVPGRPWAVGIGLLVLGLVVAMIMNVVTLSAGPSPAVRALGTLGYLAGLVVAAIGVHRLLWFGPSRRPRWLRIAVTVAVTPPVFAAAGVILGVLMTVLQARFAS